MVSYSDSLSFILPCELTVLLTLLASVGGILPGQPNNVSKALLQSLTKVSKSSGYLLVCDTYHIK